MLLVLIQSPVCGSAHCALADYWSLKMNKCDFLAYAVSTLSLTSILTLKCLLALLIVIKILETWFLGFA